VSNKFFTLIHGDSVHIAPKKKIIPANEFSVLQTAHEALESVKKDAEQHKIEVVAEIETLKEQAQREGFEVGFQQWVDKIAQLEEEILKVRADMEKQVIPVALKAAKKIVNKEIELSEDVIVDIVSANLKAVAQHKKVAIYVNRKDFAVLEANRPRLRQLFENLEALSIRERADLAQGGCIIETEGGIINAQLDNRWRVLEAAFENLLKAK